MFAALAVLLPTAQFGVQPLGASPAGTTCSSITGRAKFSPALGVLSVRTKKAYTVTMVGTFVGCAGGGVTGATFSSTYKVKAGNCATLYAAGPTPTPEPVIVAWNTKRTSTGTFQMQGAKTNPQRGTLHATTAAGLFKGLRTTAAYRFALLTKNGCTVVRLKEISISGGPVTVK